MPKHLMNRPGRINLSALRNCQIQLDGNILEKNLSDEKLSISKYHVGKFVKRGKRVLIAKKISQLYGVCNGFKLNS